MAAKAALSNRHTNGRNHHVMDLVDTTRAGLKIPSAIVKRDGRIVEFDVGRIENALTRCFGSLDHIPETPINELAQRVVNIIAAKSQGQHPTVEGVQDIVEMVLQASGEFEAAKHYILYRAERAKEREKRPVPEDVRLAFDSSRQFFPTPIQQFQFFDKYSRFNYELGRRETWIETVDRAVDFMYDLAGDRLSGETYARVHKSILNMQAMPSMRLLAMAGPAARRNNIAIYNCSYQPVESIDSFVEALIISMAGCGVGFSVESKYVENFPRIKRQLGKAALPYTVDDSAEGWADALRYGLEHWFEGGDIHFDLSQLRPAGTPLKTKGGRASGPEPFRLMLDFLRSRVLARQGSFLRPIDAHDMMCAVGNAAVSGGVRRTAMISLFDYNDDEMLQCKSGDFERDNSQRWNANNSAVWPEGGPSQLEFINQFYDMVETGRGEPGIFNRTAANVMKPARRKDADFGTNPCVTADTWVQTEFGPTQVGALLGQAFVALVDGKAWASTADGFWQTGIKDVYEITTHEGYILRATADHPLRQITKQTHKLQSETWTPVAHLREGDLLRINNHRGATWNASDYGSSIAWLLGSFIGDGTFAQQKNKSNQAIVRFWGESAEMIANMAHAVIVKEEGAHSDLLPIYNTANKFWQVGSTRLANIATHYNITPESKCVTPEIEATSSAFYSGFLRGMFDANASVIGDLEKGVSVRLSQSNLNNLQAVQRMLLRLGIASMIDQNRHLPGYRKLPNGKGGQSEYWCDAHHELVISNDNIQEFATRVGFSDPYKAACLSDLCTSYRQTPDRERFSVRIASIRSIGKQLVYDCSIPGLNAFDANGLYVHNCGEINLRPWEFCNLSAAVARVDDTLDTLRDKVEVSTIIGTIQSLATYFPGLRPIWQQNCEEERLLGVDITGQMDSPAAQDAQVKRHLREIASDVNRTLAQQLGINPSAAITCVKPSGNSSQLLNCASGLHARWAPYYVRNVRVSTHSPLFKVLRDAGVPMDPENGQTTENATTWVIHFPMRSPEGAITRNQRSAIEQCEYWLQNKLYWTDHNPSCTITYKPDEIIDLMKWVWDHHEQIGGLSFLPSFDANYAQMPYMEITREEYERLSAAFPEIDFSKVWRYEEDDLTNAAQELACVGGICEIEIVPQA